MSKANKPEVAPYTCIDHDREKYHIEVELPGAKKETIELEVGEHSFCVKAPKEDMVYNACYTLAHTVDAAKVDASFNNGMLIIKLPLKEKIGGKKVAVK